MAGGTMSNVRMNVYKISGYKDALVWAILKSK